MRQNLTPTAEVTLLNLKRRASELLAKAPQDGFTDADCARLSKIIEETKSFFGYRSYARMATDVGVSARVLTDRAKRPRVAPSLFNYQRTLDGLIQIYAQTLAEGFPDFPDKNDSPNAQWTVVPITHRAKIAHISDLLSSVILQLRRINDDSSLSDGFNDLDKAHLIEILETALVVLKAPMVEIGLLKRSAKWLAHVGRTVGDRASMAALGAAAAESSKELIQFIMGLHS
jgi:hypothetical protein